ncbi:MAG: PqqD family protein [Clostridia bacterium]|nr:PqqD family protein [Clostridia bacterium]
MQINKDFTIQKVGASYVAVPVGETSKSFHGMVRLNETGAFLWKLMAEKDCTEEELVDALLAEYEVEREIAARDVHRIVEQLAENKIFI